MVPFTKNRLTNKSRGNITLLLVEEIRLMI